MSSPLAEYLAFAHELADAAGPVLLKYFRSPLPAERKDDHTPVTIADREVEQILRDRIRARYPHHGILGEEYGSDRAGGEFCWVVDPIDGTKSFISGKPLFGCLIALCHNGAPMMGLLDQPFTRERWEGVSGGPARHNGVVIHASRVERLSAAVVATTSPYLFTESQRAVFERVQATARFAVFGGDCYAYGLLALGHVDVVIEAGLKPYDYAALVPIMERAGAIVTDWQGQALTLDSDGTILAAATPDLHREIMAAITA